MAVYTYEHTGKPCKLGKSFEWEQAMSDRSLNKCPKCRRAVKRILTVPNISFPKSDRQIKSEGFTKLVRRDSGVYENVTAREGESRVVDVGDRSTYPTFKSKK